MKWWLQLLASLFFLLASFVVAVKFGALETPFSQVWQALFTDIRTKDVLIIREIRLPRNVAALFVGASLAVSGAVMQGLTRNPLADPGLLGLTAGASAALAVTLAIFPNVQFGWIIIACFMGAAGGAGLVFAIGAVQKGGFSPFRIVLAGASVSAFLFAVAEAVGLYFHISKDVSMWTAGGMMGTTWNELQLVAPVITSGLFFALILARPLTVLSLNEEVAVGLGQHVNLIKAVLFLVITLLAGTAVALAGNIAFFGLMVPHVVYRLAGRDFRKVIPLSALVGASFMLLADTGARTLNAPFETPVAAVIAVFGLPFFLWVTRKGGHFA